MSSFLFGEPAFKSDTHGIPHKHWVFGLFFHDGLISVQSSQRQAAAPKSRISPQWGSRFSFSAFPALLHFCTVSTQKSRLNTGFRRFFFLSVTHFLTHFPYFKAEKRGFAKKKCSFSNCKRFSREARPRVLHTFGFLRPFWATFLCFRPAGQSAWRVFLYASPSPCSWAGAARLSNRAPSFPAVAASSPWRAWP